MDEWDFTLDVSDLKKIIFFLIFFNFLKDFTTLDLCAKFGKFWSMFMESY